MMTSLLRPLSLMSLLVAVSLVDQASSAECDMLGLFFACDGSTSDWMKDANNRLKLDSSTWSVIYKDGVSEEAIYTDVKLLFQFLTKKYGIQYKKDGVTTSSIGALDWKDDAYLELLGLPDNIINAKDGTAKLYPGYANENEMMVTSCAHRGLFSAKYYTTYYFAKDPITSKNTCS